MTTGKLFSASGEDKTGVSLDNAVANQDVVLCARNIVMQYPGTTALNSVNFDVHRGRVNVLIGENGAGKSTLMKILAGVEGPTSGELLLDGKPLRLLSVQDAMRHCIGMVHQELNLLPNLTVAENIFAGRELRNRFGWIDRRTQEEMSRRAMERLGHEVGAGALVESLALGDQQVVELARALAQDARILILDEPTSALSVTEVEALFRTIEELKNQGVSIIYISHRLDELLRIGDEFTVLRDGVVVGVCNRSEVSRRWLIERMTGRAVAPLASSTSGGGESARLHVEKITLRRATRDGYTREMLQGVSFSLKAGEVVGVFGLLGAGRTELLETLAGLHPEADTAVRLNGKLIPLNSPLNGTRSGIMLIPEDRKADGLMLDLSIRQNIAAAGVREGARWGFVRAEAELEKLKAVAAHLNLKISDWDRPVSSLSGGNQQKVLLARCILHSPEVLLLDEPTRGVDVGAKAEIYAILRQLASQGMSILFTTSEAEEAYALADRVFVLGRGKIRCEQRAGAFNEEQLMAAASWISKAATEVTPNYA